MRQVDLVSWLMCSHISYQLPQMSSWSFAPRTKSSISPFLPKDSCHPLPGYISREGQSWACPCKRRLQPCLSWAASVWWQCIWQVTQWGPLIQSRVQACAHTEVVIFWELPVWHGLGKWACGKGRLIFQDLPPLARPHIFILHWGPQIM
jgi:hypothetical protein